jgi:signal peptidase I
VSATSTSIRSRLRGAVSGLVLVAVLAVAATMLVPPLLGFERYVITGGSMSGTIDRGSVLFAKPVPVSDLRVGDVITYAPPQGSDARVTHRIVDVRRGRSNEPVFRTKGDANAAADPWRFTLDAPRQARAEFDVPYVGFAFMALSERPVRMLAIGLPALLVALSLLARLWREAGTDARSGEVAS